MRSFLKYTLATIVGFLIVNIFLFFIFIGIMGVVGSLFEKSVEVKANSILSIKLEGEISDRASDNPFENFNFMSFKPQKTLGLNKITEAIGKAAKDDRIKGIYLDLSEIEGNFGAFATVEEIRNALTDFKKSGKFIYSYTNLGYSQKSYYLATVADSLFVNPETPLVLTGMGGVMFFYKDMLDKIGIKVDIVKVGKYKSAVEPFTQAEISEANREQMMTFQRSLWNTMLQGISESRNMSVDTLNWIANNVDFRSTTEEKAFGLYDGIVYEDQMLAILKKKCGISGEAELNLTPLTDYQNVFVAEKKIPAKDKIAIIYAQGEIGLEQTNSAIGPELANTIREAREDKNVKAIVLRVNSPGGSALVSELIWREVDLARAAKPVIASMGNVAASGGYYISCAADTIVADPMTLTGSIGIFGQFFSGEKLFKDKMGITSSTVKITDHGDFGGGHPLPLPINSRPLNDYEKNVLQKYIERGYETFLSRVSAGRHMTRDSVHAVAQGRVWTGKDAANIGLVDVLGDLQDAIKIAAGKAGITDYRMVEYPLMKSPFEEVMGNFSASVKTKIVKEELGSYYETFDRIKQIMNMPQGMVARVPYDFTLN